MRRAFRLGLGEDHIAGEVDDELAFHVDMRTRKLIDSGMSAEAARSEALRQFGELRPVRQSCITFDEERERTMRRIRYADELRQDIGFAVRALRRNPAFTAVAVFTLALGIGANTAIFTLIDAVILRPLPVHAPLELVAIGDPARTSSMSRGGARADLVSYPLYRDLRDNNHLVTGLMATGRTQRVDVRSDSSGGGLDHPASRFVSGNYFTVLGIAPARGRLLADDDDRAVGASPVVVISDAYWQRQFGGDPNAVGRTIIVNNVQLTVIGIAPPAFVGEIVGRSNDLWFPLTMEPLLQSHDPLLDKRSVSWLLLLGRRAPGVTEAQAEAGFTTLIRQTLVDHVQAPDDTAQLRKEPVFIGSGATGFSHVRRVYRGPLLTMIAGVGLLMMIICANVANLLLARAVARTPEFSVRLAMGAGRGRLLRQLMTESAVLASLSAGVGLALAWAGSRLLLALVADGGNAIPLDIRLDLRVLLFTVAVSIVAVALFGFVPALRASRLDLAVNLRARGVTSGGFGARGQRFPVGKLMIAGQIALSLVLLMSAGLLVRSLRNLETTNVGLDRDHILMVSVDVGSRGYTGAALVEVTRSLRDRLAQIPGVVAVTYSENGIFSGTESSNLVYISGWTGRSNEDSSAASDQVGPHYVAGLGARLITGRDFTDDDTRPNGRHVVLANESFAKFYFPHGSAEGHTFRVNDTLAVEIVGVIKDVKDHALDAEPVRRYYTPYDQALNGTPTEINFVVRGSGDPARLVAAARAAVVAQDASLAIDADRPLVLSMRESIAEQRLLAQVASGFGILALLLAAIGLYGVMTYAITRRTGEIGLRIALGANPQAMIAMVLKDALTLVLTGVVAGVPLAFAAAKLLAVQLHGVSPTSVGSAAVALGVLTLAAVVAAVVPARRASRVSPLSALGQQ